MYDTVGERLSYCRNMLGLSRREFVESFGKITLPTLSRWELNYIEIPMSKINNLIKFFQQNGIEVDQEWVILGSGKPPVNKNLVTLEKLNFDELSYITLNNMKNSIKNFEIYQINSHFFEPIIYNGDYIAGIKNNHLPILNNKLCYIVKKNIVLVGVFNSDKMNLVNLFKEEQIIDNYTNIGEVMWLAKR